LNSSGFFNAIRRWTPEGNLAGEAIDQIGTAAKARCERTIS